MILTKKMNTSQNDHTICEEAFENGFIELLKPKDLHEVLALQDEVYQQLPNKKVFVRDTEEEIVKALEGKGLILGVRLSENRTLVAYRYVNFVDPTDTQHLGLDVGLNQNQRKTAIHLESTIVKASYRGNNLQRVTLKAAENEVRQRGYNHLLCTVSPFNPYSLYNVMAEGLQIKKIKRKYGEKTEGKGLWRFILHKDINKSYSYDLGSMSSVSAHDIELQRFLLNRGYTGVNVVKAKGQVQYMYME